MEQISTNSQCELSHTSSTWESQQQEWLQPTPTLACNYQAISLPSSWLKYWGFTLNSYCDWRTHKHWRTENASFTVPEFEMGPESSDDYKESPQSAIPMHDTHRTTNFHYPPPKTVTLIANPMMYSLSSSSSGLFSRCNVILRELDHRVLLGIQQLS